MPLNDNTTPAAKGRGFQSFNKDFMRSVASAGGKAAHAKGTAHKWTSEQAAAAGRKGGETRARNRAARLAQAAVPMDATAQREAAADQQQQAEVAA